MLARNKASENVISKEDVGKYEMLFPLLNSALEEMREFSKKKQDGVLNPLKVKLINRLLNEIKDLLSSENTTEYLDVMDDDTLPQNSDAVLVLGQYQAALKQFHKKYTFTENYMTHWSIEQIKKQDKKK